MWWPLTGKIDPLDPARVLEPPRLATGGLRFRAVPDDIQALNTRAIEVGDLDITAVSMFACAAIQARYVLTACGWSVGEGFGPKVVVTKGSGIEAGGDLRGRRVAVPGLQTTANLVLSLMLGSTRERPTFEALPMRFDRIAEAVAAGEGGEGGVEAGVLIHESQIDFERLGLRALVDLGAWWGGETGLALPLGANVVRRDLDARCGAGTLARVATLLRESIRYALDHRAEGLAYARTFAPPISDADLDRYVGMYVSPMTVDPGPRGLEAVRRLLSRAAGAGFAPDPGELTMV